MGWIRSRIYLGRLRRRPSGARQRPGRCRRHRRSRNPQADAASLKAKVSGGADISSSVLGSVFTAETLPRRCAYAAASVAGQSVVTRDGVWLGADWLRLSRDPEPHTGVIEREETLRALRAEVSRLETEVKNGENSQLERRHEARARLRGSARAAANRGEPAASRARRPARGARCGARLARPMRNAG